MLSNRYDEIGRSYGARGVADPRIAAAVLDGLGDAASVVNVGAGTGSYEPADRPVVAIEPSAVMAAQRPPGAAPVILASAEALPLVDDAADAAMALLTIHHWTDQQRGLRELVRVARRRVVLLTIDADVEARMWLLRDYLPEVRERDRRIFPSVATIERMTSIPARARTVPVPRDCTDGTLLAFWSRPESVLDPAARAATSGFALLDDDAEARVVARLEQDLVTGAWDARNGELRALPELDAGLRLVVLELPR